MDQRIGSSALRYGFVFGLLGGALAFGAFALSTLRRELGPDAAAFSLLSCALFLADLLLLALAGGMAARASGRVRSGAGAGALAGFLIGLGMGAGTIFDGFQRGTFHASRSPAAYGLGLAIAALILGGIVAIIGVGVGALFGLVGRAQRPPAPGPMFAQPYPGAPPYPPYPPYPGAAPYPPYPPRYAYPPYPQMPMTAAGAAAPDMPAPIIPPDAAPPDYPEP